MRTYDLAPLYRSTVGFDRLFSMLDGFDASTPGYPPYNIERTGENDYRICIAVAGFGENELTIESKENTLTVKGEKQVKDEAKGEVLYQGIAARAFERVFQLADYVEVKGANLENGLLHVELVREIPEAKKPRQIAIGNGKTRPRWSRPRCGVTPNQPTGHPQSGAPRFIRGALISGGLASVRELFERGLGLRRRRRRCDGGRRGLHLRDARFAAAAAAAAWRCGGGRALRRRRFRLRLGLGRHTLRESVPAAAAAIRCRAARA